MRVVAFVLAAFAFHQPAASWQPAFERVQPDVFAAPGGQASAWADADGDGDLDYFVAFRGRPNRFYRNDSGIFHDVAAEVGLADNQETRAAAWGDFDADGDPDLYIGFADPKVPAKVYRNDQQGRRFTDVAIAIGVSLRGVARQPAWVDYDGDGDLDLFAAFRDVANKLLRNDGGRFVDVTAASGIGDTRKTVSAVWWDFDRDGDLDLFTANQEGEANGLYRQDRGRFEDVAAALGVAGTPRPAADGGVGPSVADFDRDGDFDLFVANYGPSALYRNEAGKSFADVAKASGIDLNGHGVTSAWGDLDNDGLPDLYVGNFLGGQPLYRDALFVNRGAGGFAEALPDVILKHDATHGVQFVDFDGDGRLDLSLTNNDPDGGGHPLLRNTAPTRGRGFFVEVTDEAGRRTRAGSEIRVFQPRTRQLLAAALVDAGSGYCSQNAMPSHLGVPASWPGRVDVEVTALVGGRRLVTTIKGVDPAAYIRGPLRVATGG
ncbi:MAG: FG-GAP repeat domain-containing protein [Vicinamibacterales bacterium]